MNMLLVLGLQTDVQVQSLLSHIPNPVVLFNAHTAKHFEFTRDLRTNTYKVTLLGKPFKPKAIFWRNIFYDGFYCTADKGSNWRAYCELFMEAFPEATWFNGYKQYLEHQTKLKQLSKASKLSYIPDTLITNNLNDATEFLEEYGSLAVKPIGGADYTQRIDNEHDLAEFMLQRKQPQCFQEFIEGDNIRVYVIGDKTFKALMPCEGADFRLEKCIPEPLEIEDDLAELCIAINKKLKLQWTAMDFIYRDGIYYFLEANFSPMFHVFENYTKQPIGKTLAELILEKLNC